jgi:hypothetical protein
MYPLRAAREMSPAAFFIGNPSVKLPPCPTLSQACPTTPRTGSYCYIRTCHALSHNFYDFLKNSKNKFQISETEFQDQVFNFRGRNSKIRSQISRVGSIRVMSTD